MDSTNITNMHTYADNVLLVDDNELLLQMMKRSLARDFTDITAVCTGEEALINLRSQPYKIIVLDINLPGIDGWGVLDFIKRHSSESKVIIISCDGCTIEEDALGKGAVAVLEKPFGLEELRKICKEGLAESKVNLRTNNGWNHIGSGQESRKALPKDLL